MNPGKDMAGAMDKRSVQVYYDTGSGFNEEESYLIRDGYNIRGEAELDLEIPSNVLRLRIDPMMDWCMTELRAVTLNGGALTLTDNKRIYLNGKKLTADDGVLMLFYYDDPCIVVELKDKVRSTGNNLHVSMVTASLPEGMIAALKREVSRKIRL